MRVASSETAGGGGVPKTAAGAINDLLQQCAGYRELVPNGPGAFKQVFVQSAEGKDELLASLAVLGSDLLSAADLTLIKKCKNPACVLIDQTNQIDQINQISPVASARPPFGMIAFLSRNR